MFQNLWRKVGTIGISMFLVALVAGVTVQPSVAAPASSSGPATWTVWVGGQAGIEQQEHGPMGAWQFMRFYPESITVNVGDTILWKLNSAEMHTVTFPKPGDKAPDLTVPEGGSSQRVLFNPLAILPQGGAAFDGMALTGSGQLGGDPTFPTEYKLTFTTAGTYEYICAFHQMMKGTVVVQAAGSPYPKTQAQIDADAAAMAKMDTEAAMKAEPAARQSSTRPGPNGTTVYQVNIGYGDGMITWMRFSPAELTIHVGDTVEWVQKDVETPHTVSLTSGAKEPDIVLVEPQKAGPPKLVLNPAMLLPAGGATYSGKGYFNSGFIWGTKVPIPGPRSYSLTFDKPGTYEFACILHDEMGMRGHITVKPKGA